MYVLQFLERLSNKRDSADGVEVEYRFACSGELYNRSVRTGDWRNSDATRVLLRTPFELFVVSQPFEDYPQELCARLVLTRVTESEQRFTRTFLPDKDVIEDLSSLLSLLSRRLIVPVAKIRERRTTEIAALGSYGVDVPTPIISHSRVTSWKKRPATVITVSDQQQIINNDPPPVGVDSDALSELLRKLPTIKSAQKIVHTARLYRTALESIESRPDIAYQLLISAVETLATVALEGYSPDESQKINIKADVKKEAKKYGLTEEQANDLALRACQGIPWTKQKFIKFLVDRVPLTSLAEPDRLFFLHEYLCPPLEDLEKALRAIYDARSSSLHSGSALPHWIGIGTSEFIEPRKLPLNPLKQVEVPPVPWFERVVSLASRKFLLDQTAAESSPFVDWS